MSASLERKGQCLNPKKEKKSFAEVLRSIKTDLLGVKL